MLNPAAREAMASAGSVKVWPGPTVTVRRPEPGADEGVGVALGRAGEGEAEALGGAGEGLALARTGEGEALAWPWQESCRALMAASTSANLLSRSASRAAAAL